MTSLGSKTMNNISTLPVTKINKIPFIWLLLLGSIYVVFDAYSLGINVVQQSKSTLAEFDAQQHAFETAALGLSREIIPIQVCLMLAYLSPLIGIFEYFKVKKIDVTDHDKWRFLIKSRFKSLIIITPILVLLGLAISLLSAYFATTSHILSSTGYDDFAISMIKGMILGASIVPWGFIQIRLFFKWSKIAPIVLVYILITLLSSAMIIFLDHGISSIMNS